MPKQYLRKEYFNWMLDLVVDRHQKRPSYLHLLHHLDDLYFTVSPMVPMDENRAVDGIDLRYRFGRETGHRDPEVAAMLDYRPCSILEMMVALSLKMEESIMDDPEVGNRTGQWFWGMIVNLGLGGMYGANYDPVTVDQIISRFLDRAYDYDGKGGLFTVRAPRKDMRTVEIWYQMNWYLSETQ